MKTPFTLLGILFWAVGCGQEELNHLDYLGQSPPGTEPVLFAPGVVSTDNREHGVPVFSPDGSEVYFSRQYQGRHDILWARQTESGSWTAPEPVPFTSDGLDDGPAFFPIDGRLYFGSRRPTTSAGQVLQQTDLYHVTRDADGWGEPVRLGPPVHSETSEGFPCFAANGTMYFHSDRGGDSTLADIYRSTWNGHGFDDPEPLPAPVNSHLYEAGPYVAPDESYLIFMQADVAVPGDVRLYLSYHLNDSSWTEPIDLAAELDLPRTDLILGRVSPDQRYLFLLAGGDVYWVAADIITELRER